MTDDARFTPEEVAEIKRRIIAGDDVSCPRCGGDFDTEVVGGGGTVHHVSQYGCPACGASVTLADLN